MTTVLLAGWLGVTRLVAGSAEPVFVDRHSGLALGGFDPLSYFVERRPLSGRGQFEYGFAGATWRFRNEGNRAAFARNPHLYMPRFGGYDPVGIARGVAVAGNPAVWIIADGHLYLFHDRAALDAFFDNAEPITATAERRWPQVLRMAMP